MKFNKKFSIKTLVKVSAVALAMISAGGIASTINANTNVHAESVYQKELAESNEEDAQNQKSLDAFEKRGEIQDRSYTEKTTLQDLKNGESISPTAYNDPVIRAYLNSKGYTSHQLKNDVETPTKDLEGEAMSAITSNSPVDSYLRDNPTVHKYLRKQGFTNYEINHSGTISPNKIAKVLSNEHASDIKATARHHVVKHTHLSKSFARKIVRQIRIDKRAIRNDKKQLSSRNGKKFTKLMNRPKRAMHVRGAKRYAHYYKDEVKHEKDLVHLTKSIHASKVTKRNKRGRKNIRKNRKSYKRNKRVAHHRKQ